MCFFFCVQCSAVGRHSGCAVQCTDYANAHLEGCMQPPFFQGLIISPEYIRLNRMVVPTFCATSSHSHSALKPTELTFLIPPMSLSLLVACIDYLPVQKPIKTYSTLSTMTSKIFSSTQPSIPFGCVNKNVCGGELGSISLKSSSS